MKKSAVLTASLLVLTLVLQTTLLSLTSLSVARDSGGDIVGGASDDIASGSSVFVFKGSKKKPHVRNSFRKASFQRTAQTKTETRTKRVALSQRIAQKRQKPAATPNTRVPSLERQSMTAALAGQKFLDAKNYDQAEAKFREARRLNAKNELATSGLAATFVGRGDKAFAAKDFKTAAAFYEQSLGFDGKNADAYASLGESYDELDMSDKAALAYENAYRLNPELNSFIPALAELFYKAENYPKAEIYIREALVLTPGDADLQNTHGLVLYKLNKTDDALAAFQNAAQLQPSFAEAHYNLGEVYDRLNRENEATASYKEAMRQNPQLAEPYYGLGVMAYNRERYGESVDFYQKAIELKPDFVEARNNLADAFRQLEKFPEAVAVYKTIVPYTPNDPELFSKYGYCEGKANNWGEASKQLEKTVELENGSNADDYSNVAWAHNNAGRNAQKRSDEPAAKASFAKAKEAGQKATEKDPNSSAAKFNLGDALTALGEAAVAVTVLRAALGLRPGWAEAHNNLGLALFLAGEQDAAAGELRRATTINNSFVAAFANLAVVETKRGNKKEAERAKGRVKQLNPTMAKALDNFIAQRLINFGTNKIKNEIKKKVPLPF